MLLQDVLHYFCTTISNRRFEKRLNVYLLYARIRIRICTVRKCKSNVWSRLQNLGWSIVQSWNGPLHVSSLEWNSYGINVWHNAKCATRLYYYSSFECRLYDCLSTFPNTCTRTHATIKEIPAIVQLLPTLFTRYPTWFLCIAVKLQSVLKLFT